MNEKLAKIRTYYKYELTKLYGVSIKTFMKKLNFVYFDLEDAGYTKTQKIFTLKQTQIIFECLGHPDANSESGIHSDKKVPIYGYRKSQLAEFYNISGKTLLSQIESFPDEEVKKIIMDGNNKHVYQRRVDKQEFKRSEVILIFQYLGHPYI